MTKVFEYQRRQAPDGERWYTPVDSDLPSVTIRGASEMESLEILRHVFADGSWGGRIRGHPVIPTPDRRGRILQSTLEAKDLDASLVFSKTLVGRVDIKRAFPIMELANLVLRNRIRIEENLS